MTITATPAANIRESMTVPFQWAPPLRVRYLRELWRRIGLQALAADKPIAIYGGGRHTRFLLSVVADVEPAPYFALLDELAERHTLPLRSMGMSADYETAVTLGATHVRVGTALFGSR